MAQFAGPCQGYELIKVKDIGPSTKLVFLSMNYERAALFVRFQVYRAKAQWVFIGLHAGDKYEEVLPTWLMNELSSMSGRD
jgi:hypothetical protein